MAFGRDRKQIQDILTLIAQYEEEIAGIADRPRLQQERAAEAMRRLSEKQVSEILRGMDVENVNRDKLGLRVASLRAAGIENMEQLCALSADQINAIKGIGDEAAWLIYTLAGRIRMETQTGLKVRVSLDDRNEDAAALLLTAADAIGADKAVRLAKAVSDEYRASVEAAFLAAKPAAGMLGWLFKSAEKKKTALDAAAYLYDLLTGDYGERVRAALKAYDERKIPDKETIWDDFRANSAAYYAQLDRLDRSLRAQIDNSYSGLPEELVRAVEMQPIYVDALRAVLRPYQEFGVRYILRQGNVLLGDEMGLGKTVQAIAAMVSLNALGATHFMVVCPASVLVNWRREIEQFSALPVTVIRGEDHAALLAWREKGGAAVTTYESISRFALPEDFRFSMLVADEAHYAKNPAAKGGAHPLYDRHAAGKPRGRDVLSRLLPAPGHRRADQGDQIHFLRAAVSRKAFAGLSAPHQGGRAQRTAGAYPEGRMVRNERGGMGALRPLRSGGELHGDAPGVLGRAGQAVVQGAAPSGALR